MNYLWLSVLVCGLVILSGCLAFPDELGQPEVPFDSSEFRFIETFEGSLAGVTADGDVRFIRNESRDVVLLSLVDVTLVGYGSVEGVPQVANSECVAAVSNAVEAELTPDGPAMGVLYTVVVVPSEETDEVFVGDAFPESAVGNVTLLSERLVEQGLAVYTPAGERDPASVLAVAEERAVAEKVGVWGCEGVSS
jgi:hypothetical protein